MINPLVIEKSSNVDQIVVGESILYTIQVTNTTGVVLTSAIVKDLLNGDLEFVDGSLKVDGFSKLSADILTGVEIGPMGIGSVKQVTFLAKVIKRTESMTSNQSTIVYRYVDPDDGLSKIAEQKSNIAMVQIEVAELVCEKLVNKEVAKLGDIIQYRATLINKGTIDVFNVVYKDDLPVNLEVIPNGVKVNGVVVNDPDFVVGINVGAIAVGEEAYIDYEVKVIGGTCSGVSVNSGWATYFYVLPNKVTGQKTTNKAEASVRINISSFKQITIDKYFPVPCQKPDIEDVDDINAEILIDDSYVVNTAKGTSNEGQQLSSYKLMIHGRIKMSIEYTADLIDQPMHSAHCETPFSSFIILPVDYMMEDVDVSTIIEDVSIDMIGRRGVDLGIVFLIIAQIK